ncbi:MAG: hypothetical protein LC723_05315 [Actinobacteria bacterium]|nr:hypothetical protein [Actinomycetota bacterium]
MSHNTMFAALAGICFSAGALATVWTFDWRYVASGLVLTFFVALVAGNLLKDEGK